MGSHALLHPTEQTLNDFSLGKLDDSQAEIINDHLKQCFDCQRIVAEMSSDSFLGRLRGAQGQPGRSSEGTQPPLTGEDAGHKNRVGTLPPDLADHPDFEVVRELGRGGMGVVYLAHNRLMGRDEVLKVVSRQLIERKGVLDRFSREIRSAARLMHPNIVHAYSAFRCGDSVVFAMEYVEGLDLAKLVKSKGPMSVVHASYFVHQAALGLQHAHEQGMVHRDIKPGNLMLTRRGDKSIVKVLDFGLAKATRESPLEGALTHEGQMLGTPDFIAPEQIRDAQSAGIQADIYSLGCTLYYLLTGAPPFEAASLYDLLQAHFSMNAAPLNLLRPEVPVELAALVAKMMAKDPSRRFQTPVEVAEALKPLFKKAGAGARPQVSTLGQSDPGTEMERAVSSTPSLAPVPRSETFAEPKEPKHSGDVSPADPGPASGRRPPWKSWRLIAAAGALGVVMLGIIIIIIMRNGRTTVDSEKGNKSITVDTTVVATPSSENTPPAAATSSVGEPAANPPGDQLANTARPLPSGAKAPPVIKNSIEMKLVLIPPGQFTMGSPEEDKDAAANEKPQHPVSIRAFYLGETEVTQAQYLAVMGKNPSSRPAGGKYPVENVSWLDAALFCNALSEKEGRIPFYPEDEQNKVRAGKMPGYRLPTEAEWEYACRAGTTTRYSFGNDPWILGKYAGPGGATHPVGDVHPNEFGLYDMHGNVSEWCSDWFDEKYYERSPQNDPPGAPGPAWRVIRGRGWNSDARSARSASRGGNDPGHLHNDIGFRVALNLSNEIKGPSGNAKPGIPPSKESKTAQPRVEASNAGVGPPTVADKPPVSINSIGMKLALIPAGEFMMGSPDANSPPEERPEHKVRISMPFSMGVTEVTQSQYEAVTGTNPSFFSPKGEGRDKVAGKANGEYPVEQVSWLDAVLFCNGLSKNEGLAPYYQVKGDDVVVPDPKGPGYRLPTEAEWEYACRGGKSGRYSPGPDPLVEYGWFRANSNGSTHPVGKKRPNEFGLYDMAANVWEWCWDQYAAEYYKQSPEVDPQGPSGMSTRVRRGGSGWRSPMRASWWSNRGGIVPGDRSLVMGFRVARTQSAIPVKDKPQVPPADDRGEAAKASKSPMVQPPVPPLAKGSPEDKLQTRGLTQSGVYFVLASEAEILEKFKKVRPLIASVAQPFNMFALALRNDMLLAEADAYHNEMRARVDAANGALRKMPTGNRANSLEKMDYQSAEATVDQLTRERDNAFRLVEALRVQQIPAGRKAELVKDFNAKWSEFLKAEGELNPLIDKALSEYRKLQGDPQVRDALAAFRRSTKVEALLGPSKDLRKAADTIKDARHRYAPETAAPKRKGQASKR